MPAFTQILRGNISVPLCGLERWDNRDVGGFSIIVRLSKRLKVRVIIIDGFHGGDTSINGGEVENGIIKGITSIWTTPFWWSWLSEYASNNKFNAMWIPRLW